MMNNVGVVPFINVFNNLDYSFSFNGVNYHVKHYKHGCDNKFDTVEHGKTNARRLFYEYHLNNKESICKVTPIGIYKKERGFHYMFDLNGYTYTNDNKIMADSEVEAYNKAIKLQLELLNVKGV